MNPKKLESMKMDYQMKEALDTHLLQVKGKLKCEEMVRGKTTWKKRLNQPKSSGF